MSRTTNTVLLLALAAGAFGPAAGALAQTNVDATNKYAWGENVGWLNFRDAGNGPGSQGVRFNGTFLGGFAWGENIGWINFGDGTPDNGTTYSNVPVGGVLDFGVNVNAGTGLMSGYAWGENVGWINFNVSSLPAAQQARYDAVAYRFRGYAWGENIGWINLDSSVAGQFVSVTPPCRADINHDGSLDSGDFLAYLLAFAGGDAIADWDFSGDIDSGDFLSYLLDFAAGC